MWWLAFGGAFLCPPPLFPIPSLSLSLWPLCCSTLISLPAVFPARAVLEGGSGWSLSGAHRGCLSNPFTHDQVTPQSAALVAAAPPFASHSGVKLSCHHAVQGTPVGALGPPSLRQVYYFPLPFHTDPTPQGLCPAGVQPYPRVHQVVAPSFVIDVIYEYFPFKCLFLNSFKTAIIILLHINISNLFFQNESNYISESTTFSEMTDMFLQMP